MNAMEEVFAESMPREMGFDYLGMSFQEKKAQQGVPASAVFAFSLLFVFLILAALYESARPSNIRYKGGVTSYLEVLTNETNYFAAELNLAQAQANELLALVQLYQALGGGWQQ
jgi:AcrB/AcrD/AcrF family protein/outer membrane efflux protein